MTQARLLGGRYQVGELLGYGGMAEVHRGRDLRLGRDVAIKMLRTDLARDDTFQLRFRREAQNAASLNHPAIVAVYDTGEERGSSGESLPYIVMEYVNGRTLKEVLAVEGRLMPRRALEIVAEICSALEFSHRHGIIHRDIKPGNVMLTQTGQIKVMDFGIARALASSGSTMTQTSAVIGTAQYLSPEQARGESVDARSDVYATGCVLYELLCGQPPFVGDSPVSVAYQHVREDARPPSLLNRDVTPAIDAVVLKALAKNPLNRYQSAAEMRADLLRAAAGRPVYAEPVMIDHGPGTTRPVRPTTGGRPMHGRPDPRRRRPSPWAIAGLSGLAVVAVIALVIGLLMTRDRTVEVPNLVGMTKDAAQAQLTSAGLQVHLEPQTDPNCTVNEIIKQDPARGAAVPRNSTVRLTWCAGSGVVKIPQVIGLPKDTAAQLLTERKLKPVIKDVDSSKDLGTVIAVTPGEGETVGEGTEVTLEVSKGNYKEVPDVRGFSEEAATAILNNAGFLIVQPIPRPVTDQAQDGKVIDQSPAGDTEANPNFQVNIYIGQYEAPPTTAPPTTVTPTATPSADG
ncbi:MAG: Stk1 family PASTA domain-containing Ser/Thr kinase [Micromonosporaceae bacterium]|nr:Stk1 family PASTA domain-containing Ser/Thr kinase [Micromonosporaceae bacterium]